MIPYNQLSLADIFSNCQEIYESDKPQFLSLLQQHIDLDEIVPASFRKHFYASTGRTRKYPLYAFLWALIIQRIFSIPTDSLLLVFLQYSRHLREFCGFHKVPDASKITRFKQDFLEDLQAVFKHLVDLTEPICQAIDGAILIVSGLVPKTDITFIFFILLSFHFDFHIVNAHKINNHFYFIIILFTCYDYFIKSIVHLIHKVQIKFMKSVI